MFKGRNLGKSKKLFPLMRITIPSFSSITEISLFLFIHSSVFFILSFCHFHILLSIHLYLQIYWHNLFIGFFLKYEMSSFEN